MSAARVIDLQAVRAQREAARAPALAAAPRPSTPVGRFVWLPMVVWVPLRWG